MTHRRQRSRRRLLSFVSLLAMASTASALNLSQFQVITSNQIPKLCILAYQNEIKGCTKSDFTGGRQCSASCVKGLQQEQDLIEAACGDLNVSPRSLLGIVLSGGLVNTLCPGYETTTVTKTVEPSTTIDGFSTVKSVPTTTSKTTKASSTTSTKAKTTPTSDSSTTEQSTTNQATPAPSSTANGGDTSTPSSADASPTQNTAQSSATSEPAQSSPPDDDTPTPFVGGSPFDPAPIESLGTVVHLGSCTETLMAVIFAAMLILR
ncbi:hypothetical protein F5Y13DRAFT_38503 [Hypoxylon sp. FL1857]|nr:hypothetical protein F5Y13DRAFT_38503 [Hypoxylon sp. FL1857]